MSPSALRNEALRQLRAARLAMLSARWTLKLAKVDAETRSQAALRLLEINHAILTLENEELSEIRDELIENEEDLLAGTEALGDALKDLDRVKGVLNAVSGVLRVLGKVISLL
jgi:hypothetical protein